MELYPLISWCAAVCRYAQVHVYYFLQAYVDRRPLIGCANQCDYMNVNFAPIIG